MRSDQTPYLGHRPMRRHKKIMLGSGLLLRMRLAASARTISSAALPRMISGVYDCIIRLLTVTACPCAFKTE
jgi:hypothetical protein